MPLHMRAQCSWQVGSMLPRDVFTIDPCFRDQLGVTDDPLSGGDKQALAEDLATALKAWELAPTNHQLTVKLYDIEGTKPVRPMATAIRQANAAQQAAYMREIALCLSFYGGQNAPQNRGRLFIPHVKMSNAAPSVRPSSTERDKVAALVPIFSGLGGPDIDWIVWSPTKRAATKVEHAWVDDEWDVQRRRGDRPTTRTIVSTGG